MKVVELIRKVGAKAGLLHVQDEVQMVEIEVFEKRIISLQELQQAEQETLAAPPPEITISFPQIFEAIKLPVPAHGWTVEKVREMIRSLGRPEAGKAVLEALKKDNVPVDDIIKDAVSRDKALDSYENFVAKKMEDRSTSRKRAIEELKQQIEESQQQIHKLQSSQSKEETAFRDWQNRKVQEEEELAEAVSLFTTDHGITVGKKHT